ncbi:MAG: phage holin family protein [Planctomycetes bacterium]|nr:phage holin family protein [Planctomycetota bacterium]
MADQVQPTTTGTSGSVAPLVAGIIDDLQELIKQNLALFKVEVREDFKKTKEAAAALGVGIGLAVVGALHLTLMLVFLLWWAFNPAAPSAPGLPLWVCFAIVGGVFAGIGVALYLKGKKKLDSFNPLPDETAKALKENVQWIKNRI